MSLICSYIEGWCFIGTFPTKQKLLSPERGLHTYKRLVNQFSEEHIHGDNYSHTPFFDGLFPGVIR